MSKTSNNHHVVRISNEVPIKGIFTTIQCGYLNSEAAGYNGNVPLVIDYLDDSTEMSTNWLHEDPIGQWNNVDHLSASGYVSITGEPSYHTDWPGMLNPDDPWSSSSYSSWPGPGTIYGVRKQRLFPPISIKGGAVDTYYQEEYRRRRRIYEGNLSWTLTKLGALTEDHVTFEGYFSTYFKYTEYRKVNGDWVQYRSYESRDSGIDRPELRRSGSFEIIASPMKHMDLSSYLSSLVHHVVKGFDQICQEHADDDANSQSEFADLTQEAADNVRPLNINMPMYFKDMGELGKLAESLTATAGKGIRGLMKYASAGYLAVHYGLNLTIKDTQEIAAALPTIPSQRGWSRAGSQHSRQFTMSFMDTDISINEASRCSMWLYRVPDEDLTALGRLTQAREHLLALDLAPTLSNMWDAVPFSFVADWFIPVGEALEARESRQYLQTLPIHHSFYSRKFKTTVPINIPLSFADAELTVKGSLNLTSYKRLCMVGCIPPEYFRVHKPRGRFNHWVEASALLVQLW